jgi:hypothetical protein
MLYLTYLASLIASSFLCECKDEYRSACAGEPFFRRVEEKEYCVLHYPGNDKVDAFAEAFRRKTEQTGDLDFQGVWFPGETDFTRFKFVESDFTGAVFNGKANFYRATFSEGAYFSGARFNEEANFGGARFKEGVNFGDCAFEKAIDFNYAGFSKEVDFTRARFKASVTFRDATFGDHVRFASGKYEAFSDTASLDLQFVRVEKADRIAFHTVTLRPSWFVNVDPRSFRFTTVKWDWRTVEEEIRNVKKKNLDPEHLLSIAYRNLAINAEESHLYDDASEFRYRAMDARRFEHGRGDLRKLSWWYWLASGYGERVPLAVGVFFGMLVVFAALYTQVGFLRWEPKLTNENEAMTAVKDSYGAPLPLQRALTYSAAVLTLQKPEPKPATTTAHSVVLLETIFGPVQAALLALAIRRKFMR